MHRQFIYRQSRTAPFSLAPLPGVRFVFCRGPADGLRIGRLLARRIGLPGAMKDVLKLASARRCYACLTAGGMIVSECYVTLSRCKHYTVEPGAAVLGPVWTDAARRGQGLATGLLKATINRLLADGCTLFYTDTSDRNVAMQRVIAQCEFGAPIGERTKTGPVR